MDLRCATHVGDADTALGLLPGLLASTALGDPCLHLAALEGAGAATSAHPKLAALKQAMEARGIPACR